MGVSRKIRRLELKEIQKFIDTLPGALRKRYTDRFKQAKAVIKKPDSFSLAEQRQSERFLNDLLMKIEKESEK